MKHRVVCEIYSQIIAVRTLFVTLIPGATVVVKYYLCLGSIHRTGRLPGSMKFMHPNRGPVSGKRSRAPYMEDENG